MSKYELVHLEQGERAALYERWPTLLQVGTTNRGHPLGAHRIATDLHNAINEGHRRLGQDRATLTRGVILYGPPAAGKSMITHELERLDQSYRLVRKFKVGSGRTDEYEPITHIELERLHDEGRVVLETERYGNVYAVDRAVVTDLWAVGCVPVIHCGSRADVRRLTRQLPAQWIVVVVWCARDVARERLHARGSDLADIAARLAVYDETLREPSPPLRTVGYPIVIISSDKVQPREAVEMIHWAVTQLGLHAIE